MSRHAKQRIFEGKILLHAFSIEIFTVPIRGEVVYVPVPTTRSKKKWVPTLANCFDLFPYFQAIQGLSGKRRTRKCIVFPKAVCPGS